jgi:hypothetical protein
MLLGLLGLGLNEHYSLLGMLFWLRALYELLHGNNRGSYRTQWGTGDHLQPQRGLDGVVATIMKESWK